MSTNAEQLVAPGAPAATNREAQAGHLFGPLVDFLLLGGGSLIGLLLIRGLLGGYGTEWSLLVTLAFANIINHPHFAHSYQIFYRGFRGKLTEYPKELRWRYLAAGVVVPIVLVAFFAGAVLFESPRVLGVGANLMFFFVGWHYVKQGYGMAMVGAALKKAFYSAGEKKLLLQNSYATWMFSYILVNNLLAGSEKPYFGIAYFAIPFPTALVVLAALACMFTTYRVGAAIYSRKGEGKPIAWNGLIAYAVSLYVWLLVRDPIVLLWVPLFHSLQYLAVVWRFERNRSDSIEGSLRPSIRFGLFIAVGFALGYLGFWTVPQYLDANVPYSRELFGSSLFIFIFWIFINVHHYFLDSVMWRRGNPDVQEHLFSHQH
jgi:hypothetical protein